MIVCVDRWLLSVVSRFELRVRVRVLSLHAANVHCCVVLRQGVVQEGLSLTFDFPSSISRMVSASLLCQFLCDLDAELRWLLILLENWDFVIQLV